MPRNLKFGYTFQTPRGKWSWYAVADFSTDPASYRIEEITSPYSRWVEPLPSTVLQEMAASITTIVQTYSPVILANPNNLTFTVDEGRGASASQTFTVTNTGILGSYLNASVTPSDTFLHATPVNLPGMSENEQGIVTVWVDSTNLVAAMTPYNASVSITAPNAVNTPQTVNVTVNVRPIAVIDVVPLVINRHVTKPLVGPFPPMPSSIVIIANAVLDPASVLEYQVRKLTGLSPWITGTYPATGTLNGNQSTLFSIDFAPPATMQRGSYTETLRVSGYSSNGHVDVTVNLVIT